MKDCKDCIWYGKEKPGQCGNYLCRNQSEYDPRTGVEEADPAADVRPVVLCKDCRHRDPEDHKCDCGGTERQGCPFKVADDYFCAYGER